MPGLGGAANANASVCQPSHIGASVTARAHGWASILEDGIPTAAFPYVDCNATIGLTLAARRAGNQLAIPAASSTTAQMTMATGT